MEGEELKRGKRVEKKEVVNKEDVSHAGRICQVFKEGRDCLLRGSLPIPLLYYHIIALLLFPSCCLSKKCRFQPMWC